MFRSPESGACKPTFAWRIGIEFAEPPNNARTHATKVRCNSESSVRLPANVRRDNARTKDDINDHRLGHTEGPFTAPHRAA